MKKRTHVVKCSGVERTVSSGGHPQLNLTLRVVEHVDGPEPRKVGDEFIMFKPIVLSSPESIQYTVDALRTLGMNNDDIMNPQGLGRLKARCVEVWDTYKGKGRWQAKYINSLKFQPKAMDESTADEFQALLNDALAQAEVVEATDDNEVDVLAD